MKRRHLFWVAWLALGMSACTTFRPPPLETAKACADWRWIGISRPETRCPEIPGWTVRPLFPQLAPAQRKSEDYCKREKYTRGDYCDEIKYERVPDSELIRELNRFCVYEPKHPKKIFKKPPFPPAASADLVRFDQDCAALSLADKELDPKVWNANYKDFLPREPETPLKNDNQRGVRLAFLDTQPTGEGVPESSGNSPHGYTLAHLARHLVCAPDSDDHCAAQITTQLALPIIAFDPKEPKLNWIDEKRGGYIGMQSDLAEAIRSEVDSWQKNRRSENSQRHLVLNLSIAWDGELFGGLGEEQIAQMRAGTQAVYRALQYATGFDALVLAAAGNQKREPCANIGPLLPAAWERGALQEDSCHKADKPLLYAVGGLQANDQPLANARVGGMPRRATYSETAVVAPEERFPAKNISSGTIYSGSSVATAVVSSIAAVVWNSFPDHDSHWVMDILDRSGEVLDYPADFWFDTSVPSTSPIPMVHKLSLCAALMEAVADCVRSGSASCPTPPLCELHRSDLRVVPRSNDSRISTKGSCQPWVLPQPEDDPCLACIPPPR